LKLNRTHEANLMRLGCWIFCFGFAATQILLTSDSKARSQDFLNDGPPVLVKTSYGPVEGQQIKDLQIFRGIPYAAPPVGSLRFRPPVAPTAWSRPLAAKVRTPACAQVLYYDPTENSNELMSEDCLTLNVWTPHADAKARPVMVFIHGGALVGGSARNTWYDGTTLAKRGDVVVVTIQYRLGVLGFLELAKIGGKDFEESGNVGFLDQIAALRWVQRNIANFGGDPKNVTIFGESAGGASVYAHMGNPRSQGLFHKAIIESGVPGEFSSLEDATAAAQKIMTAAAVDSVQQLQKLTMEQMLRLESKTGEDDGAFVYDDVVFKSPPLHAIAAGNLANVPLIIGSNLDEIRYWTAMDAEPVVVQKSNEALAKQLDPLVGPKAGILVDAYMKDYPTYYDAVVTMAGDIAFRMPSIRIAEANSPHQPTYMYLFMYRSTTRGQTGLEYGSAHSMELPFVFGVEYPDVLVVTGPKKDWGKLMDQVTAAWTNFARTGDPNGDGVPAWPRYDAVARSTMEFGSPESKVAEDPFSAERKAWADVPPDKIVGALGSWGKLLTGND
jgi:para-nitrobenzyl esterase